MKKKVLIILSLLITCIPFQNNLKVEASSNINKKTREYCSLERTWGSDYNRRIKKITMPFKIKQLGGKAMKREKNISTEKDCNEINNLYYDRWDPGFAFFADVYYRPQISYSVTDIKYREIVNFNTKDFKNNNELKKKYTSYITTYSYDEDIKGPKIDDKNVNYRFNFNDEIKIDNISSQITCADDYVRDHISKCELDRIDNFEKVNNRKIGTYPITIVYKDYYGNETKIYRNIIVEDREKPVLSLKEGMELTFEKNQNIKNVNLRNYFDISMNSSILSFSSTIATIDTSITGNKKIVISIKNNSINTIFTYNYTVKIIDKSAPNETNLFGLRNNYTIEYKSNLEEFKKSLEKELNCKINMFENKKCDIKVDTSKINTSKIGYHNFEITLMNGYKKSNTIIKTVKIEDSSSPKVIGNNYIKLQKGIYDKAKFTSELYINEKIFKVETESGEPEVDFTLSTKFDELGVYENIMKITNTSGKTFIHYFIIEIIDASELGDNDLKGVKNNYNIELGKEIFKDQFLSIAYCENTIEVNESCVVKDIEKFNKIDFNQVGVYKLNYVLENRHGVESIVTRQVTVKDTEKPKVTLENLNSNVDNNVIVMELNNILRDSDYLALLNIKIKSEIKNIEVDRSQVIQSLGYYEVEFIITNTSNETFYYTFPVEVVDKTALTSQSLKGIKNPYTIEYGTVISDEYIEELFEDLYCDNLVEVGYECFIELPRLETVNTKKLGEYTEIVEIKTRHNESTFVKVKIQTEDNKKPEIDTEQITIVIEVNEEFEIRIEEFMNQYNVESQTEITDLNYYIKNESDKKVNQVEINDKLGIYTVVIELTNESNKTFEYFTKLQYVDTTAPEITTFGNLTKEVGEEITNEEINSHIEIQQYSDNYNKKYELRYEYERLDDLDYMKKGEYGYNVKIYDESNNLTEYTWNLKYVDATPPEVELKQEEVQLLLSDTYFDFIDLMIINDNSSDVISKEIVFSNVVYGEPGEYEVHLLAQDESFNKTRVLVTVKIANISGELIGNQNYHLEYGETYQELGMTARHEVRGDITNEIKIKNEFLGNDKKDLGNYKVEYYILEGNLEIVLGNRTIIHEDTKPPEFVNLLDKYTIKNNLNFNLMDEFTTEDQYSSLEKGDLKVWYEGEFDLSANGTYNLVVNAEDSSKNKVVKKVTIKVENDTKEEISSATIAKIAIGVGASGAGVIIYILKKS